MKKSNSHHIEKTQNSFNEYFLNHESNKKLKRKDLKAVLPSLATRYINILIDIYIYWNYSKDLKKIDFHFKEKNLYNEHLNLTWLENFSKQKYDNFNKIEKIGSTITPFIKFLNEKRNPPNLLKIGESNNKTFLKKDKYTIVKIGHTKKYDNLIKI